MRTDVASLLKSVRPLPIMGETEDSDGWTARWRKPEILIALLLRETRLTVLEGMYTAAAGMAAQQTRLDAVASDLANVDTTGYKSARVAFRDLVYDDAQGFGAAKGVTIGPGSARPPSAARRRRARCR